MLIGQSVSHYKLLEKIGEYDKAINEIESLLSIPSYFSVNLLNYYPSFDPLRDHPRFQELIEKYGEKD